MAEISMMAVSRSSLRYGGIPLVLLILLSIAGCAGFCEKTTGSDKPITEEAVGDVDDGVPGETEQAIESPGEAVSAPAETRAREEKRVEDVKESKTSDDVGRASPEPSQPVMPEQKLGPQKEVNVKPEPETETETKPQVRQKAPQEPDAKAPLPPLDLTSLEQRLKETGAIGVFTKLALKNQVDDLLDKFRAYYKGKSKTTPLQLRQSYDMLIIKVMTLLQDEDPKLARDLLDSREAIWGILVDPDKFAAI